MAQIAKINGAVSPIEEAEKINELVDGVNAAATATDITAMLSALYPVGSIYIGTQSTCPLATLISDSTWELVATNRALWGGNGTNANTWIAAGLPNILGNVATAITRGSPTGAFVQGDQAGTNVVGTQSTTTLQHDYLYFDASRSNSIYGNSNTVQPPAYVVNVWCRTA